MHPFAKRVRLAVSKVIRKGTQDLKRLVIRWFTIQYKYFIVPYGFRLYQLSIVIIFAAYDHA